MLEVALMRALRVDLGIAVSLHTFAGLIDIEKFFDIVRISHLIQAGLELGFCPITLHMALPMHIAPRTLCVTTPVGKYYTNPDQRLVHFIWMCNFC